MLRLTILDIRLMTIMRIITSKNIIFNNVNIDNNNANNDNNNDNNDNNNCNNGINKNNNIHNKNRNLITMVNAHLKHTQIKTFEAMRKHITHA